MLLSVLLYRVVQIWQTDRKVVILISLYNMVSAQCRFWQWSHSVMWEKFGKCVCLCDIDL